MSFKVKDLGGGFTLIEDCNICSDETLIALDYQVKDFRVRLNASSDNQNAYGKLMFDLFKHLLTTTKETSCHSNHKSKP